MFGSPAIIGYYRQLCEYRDRCNARAYSDEYGTLMGPGDVYRVFTWTNLLKHLTLATTPDVVAIWTIATTQIHLLSKFVQRTEYSQHMRKSYDYIRRDSCLDECVCEECYEAPNASIIFPREMYKMAGRYLKYRLKLFIDAINETVSDQTHNIERGMATNPNVFRAVLSYPSSITEIGTVISDIKAVNATISTDAVHGSWNIDWNRYPTTMYNPSKYSKSDDRVSLEVVDGRFIERINKMRRDMQRIRCLLIDAVNDNDVGKFNMYKEVFCLAADTLLTVIDSFSNGKIYSDDSHKPDISNLYKYIFTEDAESTGKETKTTNNRDMRFRCALQLKRLTPAAALCLGDSIISVFKDGWAPNWSLSFIDQLCPKHANCDVLGFIWEEYMWSRHTEEQLKRVIDIQNSDSKRGGNSHE